MDEPGLIIIGSGPGGISAADAFRQHDRDLPVRILTADPELPYARPPLSKDFLRGSTDDVRLHPADWYAERRIELQLATEVVGFDPEARTVTAGSKTYGYTSLVLACGAAPTPLPVPGGDRALQLRSLNDAVRLRKSAVDAASAVVVGAGFIGCEVAASLALNGLAVTLVAPEQVPQEKRLGSDAGRRLREMVEASGARYVGGVSVREIEDGVVRLDNGVSINCDLVVAATGVTPRSDIAAHAGLTIRHSRVVVGSDMRTSAPGVYAVGDVALAFNTGVGRHIAVEHWQDADDQGAIAGAHAAGQPSAWQSVPGFWSTIGGATVKYHAWGDGYDHDRLLERADGFTVWYEAGGAVVGVLTHNADDDYDAGESFVVYARPTPIPVK